MDVSHKKRIIICGYYGIGNFGDELMLRNLIHQLIPYYEVNVIAFNVAPLWIENEFHGQIRIVRTSIRRSIITRIISTFQHVVTIWRSDLIIIGGGTFIFDNVSNSYKNLLGTVRLASICRLLHKDFSLLGIGIGELISPQGRALSRYILNSAKLIALRDPSSFEKASNIIGNKSKTVLARSADLAFLVLDDETNEEQYNSVIEPASDQFTIAFCGREIYFLENVGITEEELCNILSIVFDKIVGPKFRIVFVPLQSSSLRDDNRIHQRIFDGMKRNCYAEIVEPHNEFQHIYRELGNADLVIGMRLHSLIASVLLRTPIVGLSISNKVNIFLKESGLQEYHMPINKIKDPEILLNYLSAIIHNVENRNYPNLSNFIKEQHDLAQVNMTSLMSL